MLWSNTVEKSGLYSKVFTLGAHPLTPHCKAVAAPRRLGLEGGHWEFSFFDLCGQSYSQNCVVCSFSFILS